MTYDENNIFAKILRKEIPSKIIMETKYTLAFEDIQPQRKIHLLLIPKGAYTDISDFALRASEEEKLAIFESISKLADRFNLKEKGYRVITNQGEFGGQEVPHLHFHILGGEHVGKMLETYLEN